MHPEMLSIYGYPNSHSAPEASVPKPLFSLTMHRDDWDQTLNHYLTFSASSLSDAHCDELVENFIRLDASFIERRRADIEKLLKNLTYSQRQTLLDRARQPEIWRELIQSLRI
jgi:hypothetical protein